MGRYLAGAASALLLAAAGFFLWTGLAHRDVALPPPPAAIATLVGNTAAAQAPAVEDAPRPRKRRANKSASIATTATRTAGSIATNICSRGIATSPSSIAMATASCHSRNMR